MMQSAVVHEGDSAQPGLLHFVGVGLSVGLLGLMIALAAAVIVIPALVGGVPLTVLTGSMEPTLPPGTLVVVRPTPVQDIRVGSVLTYQIRSGEPDVVSHRVLSRSVSTDGTTTFITKGDNNDSPDANPVTPAQIKGTVWYSVPLLGYVNNAVNGPARAWVTPGVAAVLFIYSGYMMVGAALSTWRKRRGSQRTVPAGADTAQAN
ncbi:MAG TPA: signal peptidase I [Mycobacterium sp.]|nr:signal peptidase I [Mycobacterium sp.]